jgi:hypothetical protein
MSAKAATINPGTCCVCGCTTERACPGGCAWVDEDQTVCSECFVPALERGLVREVQINTDVTVVRRVTVKPVASRMNTRARR